MKILIVQGYFFTTTAERELVRDVTVELCQFALVYDTKLNSTAESSDKRRIEGESVNAGDQNTGGNKGPDEAFDEAGNKIAVTESGVLSVKDKKGVPVTERSFSSLELKEAYLHSVQDWCLQSPLHVRQCSWSAWCFSCLLWLVPS